MDQYDRDRAERDFRMNTPNTAPGQGDNIEWNDEIPTDVSSIIDDSAFTGSNLVDSTLGNMSNQQNNNSMNNNNISRDTDEEIARFVAKAAITGGKGTANFIVALFKSFSNNTRGDWHVLGSRISIVSFICIGIGFFFLILKPFVPTIDQPQTMIAAGGISLFFGLPLLLKFEKDGSDVKNEPENNSDDSFNDVSFTPELDNSFNDFSFDDDVISEEPSVEDEWADFENDLFEEEEDEEEPYIENTGIGSDNFNMQERLDSIQISQQGVWTRQFLYESYCSILPNISPNFDTMKKTTDMTDEFMMFSGYLRDSAYQVGTKDDYIPELLEIRKNAFIIQLRASRPVGLKEQEIADAVADLYSRNEDGKVVREGVYATVDSMVGTLIINIFTGETAMVSLKDIYGHISDFVKDTSVKMPFVWGIDETGDPYYCDLKDCDSITVSGEGRGGKSWKGQSIVAQLAMYNSPKELEFYIFDCKNTSSDYRYPATALPHVKYFCGDGKRINEGIQRLIDFTLKETGNILAEDGVLNIKDYNNKHPNDKLPYRYVVVDELLAMMNSFEKEEQEEFKKLTSTIVSKLAYLGIRLILFPHRIVDSIISKNTYTLISSRAVVRQLNEDEIKNALGVTPRQFPYKLVNYGDMAIRSKEIAKGKVVFCHAEVLTSDNEGNKSVFDFIGSLWKKLCPECECMDLPSTASVGGHIGSYRAGGNVVTKNHKVVDHTEGMEEYNYTKTQSEDLYNIDKAFEDLDNSGEETDDFWNDVFNDSTEGL